jgi:hypothetical protein
VEIAMTPHYDSARKASTFRAALGLQSYRRSKKSADPVRASSAFACPLKFVVTPRPLMQKAADKCGVFAV